ncbi:MAG: ribonuclease III [Deltaproteobacteria bacterium]|nr:ribonuclease III [Deltaproteobacteria bacterium]MBK8234267.1 ribonuclease III [Deltaproteobacteria bacterium]MBP7290440.1 hypothetical protein [Nannocystaceae bacterium]
MSEADDGIDRAALARRSVRTLAWLGDALFENVVRHRVAARGDFAVDRLDAIKAEVVRAERQAELLEAITPALLEDELAVVRRGRNTAPPASARGRRNTQEYRAASALEALVAHWWLGEGRPRFDALLVPLLERAIDDALARRAQRPRRG